MTDEQTMIAPPGIGKAVLSDPLLCKRYGQIVAAYDPDTVVGGVYSLNSKQWVLRYPISQGEHAALVAAAVAAIEEAANGSLQ
jgi:hypothetical protein